MIWGALAVLAVCCLANALLIWRIDAALQMRHPQVHEQIYGMNAIYRLIWFAITRRDRRLCDPKLSAWTKQFLAVNLSAIATLLVMPLLV